MSCKRNIRRESSGCLRKDFNAEDAESAEERKGVNCNFFMTLWEYRAKPGACWSRNPAKAGGNLKDPLTACPYGAFVQKLRVLSDLCV
jgi:hypothetical protein